MPGKTPMERTVRVSTAKSSKAIISTREADGVSSQRVLENSFPVVKKTAPNAVNKGTRRYR